MEKALDARISMGVVGDLGRFTQFQVANAIPLAAQNEGGAAGAGIGIGAGISMWQTMAQGMLAATQTNTTNATNATNANPAAGYTPGVAPASPADEIAATLEKLHALVGKGILSQSEFDAKKEELLKKLG